ncbi:MAG: ribose 5-phosphate isomerase B [Sedimentisphaerales bacterium]|nr:ribose 5-phosphate isomerase B [Sedimentisphaerales bacterium]
MMKVALGSDHRGYKAKELIKTIVMQLGHECIDFGAVDNNPVDYPDTAYLAARAVAENRADRAILACGTGIGMCITANKVQGVRAALCYDELSARISRHHNDANALCVSGELLGEVLLRKMVEVWLGTDFAGGRHLRRVRKIQAIEHGKDPSSVKNNAD